MPQEGLLFIKLNHHLGWVAPDDMHMVEQKINISQPGAKGLEGRRYMVVDLSHT